MRHVIVGSGIAGLVAAETIRAADPSAELVVVGEETHPFYSRPGLAYLLRGDIPEKQLFIRSSNEVKLLNAERIAGRVEQVLYADHALLLSDGRRLAYDRLLLATGALAVPPPFPGGDLVGVVKIDSLDDTRHILKLARRSRTAVVVGGGITALELVEGLHARGLHVHYFMRGVRYWADVLDETESRIVLDRLKHDGIEVHTQTQVKQALGSKGRVTGVETQAGATVACDILAVAVGVRPRVDLAKKSGLKVNKGIVVDAMMRTSAPDVFAAGDAAEVVDPAGGQPVLDVLWSTALVQGQVVGANMAGKKTVYVRGESFNVTQLTGLKTTIIGAVGNGKDEDLLTIARGDSESWRRLPKAWIASEQDDVNRVRVVLGENRIVGALVMGDQTWSFPLQRLVAARADITPILDDLRRDGPAAALAHLARYYREWERATSR